METVPDGSEESAIALGFEGVDGLVWECDSGLLEGLETGIQIDEGEFEVQGRWQSLEDASSGRNDLAANAVTGFGQEGPYAHRAGYDYIVQGMSGLMSITGEAGGEPMKVGVAVVDVFTGLYASTAILAALRERDRSGRGQRVDMALLDVALSRYGISFFMQDLTAASLDHAMWFHRPFRADDWLLYCQDSPSSNGGRSLARGEIFTREGTLVVSVAQEGLIRTIRSKPAKS